MIAVSKKLEIQSLVTNKEAFSGYFLDLVTKNYTYKDFKNLLPEEKTKVFADFTVMALQQSGESKLISQSVRNQSVKLFESGKQQEAIDLFQTQIIEKGVATANDHSFLGKLYLLTSQFDKSLQTMEIALKMDKSALDIQLNLAHAYLLTGDFRKAKEIHKHCKNQNISANVSWKTQTQIDFEQFKANGIDSKDFKRILNILE